MPYKLIATEQFLEDRNELPVEIRKKLDRKLELFEEDPYNNSFRTHDWQRFKGDTLIRSYIDDDYRIIWLKENLWDIVLLRANNHEVVDRIERSNKVPSFKKSDTKLTSRPEKSPRNEISPNTVQKSGKAKGLFNWVPEPILFVIGVPEEAIDAVKSVMDEEAIQDLKLKPSVEEILMAIYTAPVGYQDRPSEILNLLRRANARELEQYPKGKIKGLLLDLSPDQKRLVTAETTGVTLIKGVAGSGKTTVGMYRALHRAKQSDMFSNSSILFLTYTETLARVIKQMFDELQEADEESWEQTISVFTFRDWAIEKIKATSPQLNCNHDLAEDCLTRAMTRTIPNIPAHTKRRRKEFLLREISQVIKGRGISTLEEYKNIERSGRGKPLNEQARKLVWKVYEAYEGELIQANLMDEADLYLKAHAIVENDPNFEPFREVVIDEAQDLPPTALRLAAALAGGGTSQHLTLLADLNQSIYYRGIPWKDGGIELHGSRVKTLSKSYRNTLQILEAAWAFSEAVKEGRLEEAILPEKSNNKIGPKPLWMKSPNQSGQDLKDLKELIYELHRDRGFRYGDIAVLARTNGDIKIIEAYLSNTANILVAHYRDEKFEILENAVKVITINSAKGLEFPVVILFGMDEGKLPRNLERYTDPKDLEQELRMERQLLYVGMTRASEALFIFSTEGKSSRFLSDIPPELLDIESAQR